MGLRYPSLTELLLPDSLSPEEGPFSMYQPQGASPVVVPHKILMLTTLFALLLLEVSMCPMLKQLPHPLVSLSLSLCSSSLRSLP